MDKGMMISISAGKPSPKNGGGDPVLDALDRITKEIEDLERDYISSKGGAPRDEEMGTGDGDEESDEDFLKRVSK